MLCQKILHERSRMGRCTDTISLICSLGYCECDGHTVHKLSQRRLTADWLAPRESDCSRMRSKVHSDWLPSHIKTTRPVLQTFKTAGYFPDSPRIYRLYGEFSEQDRPTWRTQRPTLTSNSVLQMYIQRLCSSRFNTAKAMRKKQRIPCEELPRKSLKTDYFIQTTEINTRTILNATSVYLHPIFLYSFQNSIVTTTPVASTL